LRDGGLKAEGTDEKPTDGRQQDELPRGGRHDGLRLTCDATEVSGRQYHSDDDHRAKDQDRHADNYHRL
jgi:hypothetical protein